mgnify:CR=1 FL=1
MKVLALADVPDVPLARVADETAAQAAGAELVLGYQQERLALWRPGGAERPLSVDFDHGALGYRLAADRVRHERLVRAVGKITGNGLLVDGTAGLGRDGALLAQAGWQVTLLERQPVLQALLADGLARYGATAALTLVCADSSTWLAQHPRSAEVVYLDPMFPERHKSAAVRKELRWLQWLCDNDASLHDRIEVEQTLLQAALLAACRRVVVKRSLRAAPLAARPAASSLNGKTVRFDIYPVAAQ